MDVNSFFSQPLDKVENVLWDKVIQFRIFVLDAIGRHPTNLYELLIKHVWNFVTQTS